MKTFAVLTFLLLSARLAAVEFDSPARIDGRTDKDPLSYEVGEKIVFTLRLADLGREIPAGSRIKWRRSGDDGKVESGELRPTIFRVLPVTEAEAAHALLANSESVGKVVLEVRGH